MYYSTAQTASPQWTVYVRKTHTISWNSEKQELLLQRYVVFYWCGFQFQLVFLYRIFVELKLRVFFVIKLELLKPSQLDSSDYFDEWFVVFGHFLWWFVTNTHTHFDDNKMIHNKANPNTNQSHLQQSNILKLHDVRSFITFCCSNP